ncbi:Hsp70 family protein [Mangrovihabitans endophyticus]|uniref:Hsp70 protein n=1 Tax=Mangrovihabitans endophyticus TaxID=1751298 RepID=A0A8J3C2G0_9ACTN|nr:Hsp70 family protein [Mangrovihabitans endophyticus]GGK99484.1 hypothetical protein GCM10012284_37390 [Mangrovihabitans endophyticus]
MPTGDLLLSVHLGPRWTAAVATTAGRTWPVTFDGQTRMPSGAWIDPESGTATVAAAGLAAAESPDAYLADPMSALRTATDTDPRPAAAVSAVLAHVANTACAQTGAAVAALTVTTPQPWGPKSRQRLTQAATTAGLPEPAIVTTAAAAAAAAASSSADGQRGRFVLVCTIGDDHPHLAVLDAADRYTQLAATTVRDPAQPGIHHALAAAIRHRSSADTNPPQETESQEMGWQAATEIDRARTALLTTLRTPVLLPGHADAVVVEPGDLYHAVRPHLDQLGPALAEALTDADIDHTDITATVLVAADATAPTAQIALAEAKMPPPTTLTQPDQIATGAAHLTGNLRTSATPTAATTRLPRTRLTIGNLTTVAVLTAASIALLFQTISTADVSTFAGNVTGVRLPVATLALAAAIAATSATAVAQLAPTTWLSLRGSNDPASTGWLLRRAYLAAAATSLALAGLWGLAAGVGVEYTDPQYLRWALTAAAPITAGAVITAAVSPRIPATRLGDWITRMRPPLWAIAAAATGVYLVRAAYTLTFPVNLTGFPTLTATIGAALLAAGTAATASRHLAIRAAISLILVPGYALVVTVNTIGYLTATYTATLTGWHLATTMHTLREALPDNPLTRWLTKT